MGKFRRLEPQDAFPSGDTNCVIGVVEFSTGDKPLKIAFL